MTADNDSKKFWFYPGCFAELSLEYSGAWSEKIPVVTNCPVCGDKLLEVPNQQALWDVRYHMARIHEALNPVGKEKEGGEA